jgi:hypothetical protein
VFVLLEKGEISKLKRKWARPGAPNFCTNNHNNANNGVMMQNMELIKAITKPMPNESVKNAWRQQPRQFDPCQQWHSRVKDRYSALARRGTQIIWGSAGRGSSVVSSAGTCLLR